MRILNICYDDYSNFAYSQTLAMKTAGMEVEGMKLRAHAFGYAEQLPVVSTREMKRAIRNADLVQIFHSCRTTANTVKETDVTKPVTVWHTGSTYRSDPDGVRQFFNNLNVQKSFTDQCEFLMIDPMLNYVAVPVPELSTRIEANTGSLRVAHYPSKSEIKGTKDIIRMMERFSDLCDFVVDDSLVPHDKQLERMQDCDIYIELFKLELNGRPYGCFGVTAFEAAALGKIVVTNNIYKEAYESVYGPCELVIANTEEGFNTYMSDLLSWDIGRIGTKMAATQDWVTRNHSYLATGTRIKNLLSDL